VGKTESVDEASVDDEEPTSTSSAPTVEVVELSEEDVGVGWASVVVDDVASTSAETKDGVESSEDVGETSEESVGTGVAWEGASAVDDAGSTSAATKEGAAAEPSEDIVEMRERSGG